MTRSFALVRHAPPFFLPFHRPRKTEVRRRRQDRDLLTGLEIVPIGRACSAKRRIDKMSLPVPRDFVSRP